MPTGADHLPTDTTTLMRRMAALERDFKEFKAARRLESASVGAGGLQVVNGGRLAVSTPDRHRVIDFGQIDNDAYDHTDGSRQQALFMRREDGSMVFACYAYPPASGDDQYWNFYDRSGNAILTEDGSSGTGLGRPYLPMNAPIPSDSSLWPKTTASGWTAIASVWNTRWQPKMRIYGLTATVGTATGEIQVYVNGVAWGPVVSVGGVIDYTAAPSVDIGQQFQIEVQARRLTGTGSICAQIFMVYGRQS
ncbi:hypothetical protein [Streptomyces sp. NPDC060198]|uniref:hypothetical protein n=1 Tax=Streptomyces sp. NPDC060198 TaxID=3347070 RepID=UPI003650CAD2